MLRPSASLLQIRKDSEESLWDSLHSVQKKEWESAWESELSKLDFTGTLKRIEHFEDIQDAVANQDKIEECQVYLFDTVMLFTWEIPFEIKDVAKVDRNIGISLDEEVPMTNERWDPDAAECFYCQQGFGIFNNRHHCRACGRNVCDSCSPYLEVFQPKHGYGPYPQRLCVHCKAEVKENFSKSVVHRVTKEVSCATVSFPELQYHNEKYHLDPDPDDPEAGAEKQFVVTPLSREDYHSKQIEELGWADCMFKVCGKAAPRKEEGEAAEHSSMAQHILIAKSQAQRDEWVNRIRACTEEMVQRSERRRKGVVEDLLDDRDEEAEAVGMQGHATDDTTSEKARHLEGNKKGGTGQFANNSFVEYKGKRCKVIEAVPDTGGTYHYTIREPNQHEYIYKVKEEDLKKLHTEVGHHQPRNQSPGRASVAARVPTECNATTTRDLGRSRSRPLVRTKTRHKVHVGLMQELKAGFHEERRDEQQFV